MELDKVDPIQTPIGVFIQFPSITKNEEVLYVLVSIHITCYCLCDKHVFTFIF